MPEQKWIKNAMCEILFGFQTLTDRYMYFIDPRLGLFCFVCFLDNFEILSLFPHNTFFIYFLNYNLIQKTNACTPDFKSFGACPPTAVVLLNSVITHTHCPYTEFTVIPVMDLSVLLSVEPSLTERTSRCIGSVLVTKIIIYIFNRLGSVLLTAFRQTIKPSPLWDCIECEVNIWTQVFNVSDFRLKSQGFYSNGSVVFNTIQKCCN